MRLAIDSSAIVAIALKESECNSFRAIIADHQWRYVSPINYVETAMVFSSHFGKDNVRILREFVEELGLIIKPTDWEQTQIALQAFQQFGKGRHPAKLNLGDCFAYALAKQLNAPLLYKGDDFGQTDISAALASD